MDGSPKDGILFGRLARKMSTAEAVEALPRIVLGLVRGTYTFYAAGCAVGSSRRVFFCVANKPELRGWIREDDLVLCKSLALDFGGDIGSLSISSSFPSDPEQQLLLRIGARVRVEYPQRG